MLSVTWSQIGLVVLCYFAYKTVHAYWSYRTFKSFAKAHGCEEPHNISSRFGPWPFSALDGIARLRKIVRMRKTGADLLDDVFSDMFAPGPTTKSTSFEGSVSLATIEPANLQAMLATQFKDFEIGQMRINQFYPLLGKSIFSSDGAFWEHSRSMFRPQFNREQINDLEDTEAAFQALIGAIGAVESHGWSRVVELQPLLFNFTLDTATAFLFGESVNSQAFAIKEPTGLNTYTDDLIFQKQFTDDFELASKVLPLTCNFSTRMLTSDCEVHDVSRTFPIDVSDRRWVGVPQSDLSPQDLHRDIRAKSTEPHDAR